jgi:hypothetical protein
MMKLKSLIRPRFDASASTRGVKRRDARADDCHRRDRRARAVVARRNARRETRDVDE